MSVILKALRASQEQEQEQEQEQKALDNSNKLDNFYFRPNTPSNSLTKLSLSPRLLISIIIIIMGAGVIFWVSNSGSFQITQQKPSQQLSHAQLTQQAKQKESLIWENLESQANKAYHANNFTKSITLYKQLINNQPNKAQSQIAKYKNRLGLIYLKQNQFEKSQGHFNQALELNKDCHECLNNLGYLNTLNNQAKIAEQLFIKSIRVKPDYAEAYFNLGVLYDKNGDKGNAIKAYQNYVTYSKNNNIKGKIRSHLIKLNAKNRDEL